MQTSNISPTSCYIYDKENEEKLKNENKNKNFNRSKAYS